MSYKETDLMLDIIELIELRWVTVDKITQLTNKAKLSNIEQKIAFLRELKRLIRLFPTDVFNDLEQRQNLISAVQEAQDMAIDEEEDEINGMGQ